MGKRQKTMLVSILVILLLIVFLAGYTFAKYYTSYNGSGTLQIAKWSFKVDNWSVYETNEVSLADTASEVNLDDGKIAPGFVGQAQLDLDASDSEVDVAYSIKAIESGHKPENMIFQAVIDGQNTTTYSTLTDLANNELNDKILKSDANQTKTIIIKAIWPFETGDTNDEIEVADKVDTAAGTGTTEGKENVFDYTFALKVIGTQAKAGV